MLRAVLIILLMLPLPVRVFAQEMPRFDITPCPLTAIVEGEIEGETFYCGTLVVPESRDEANSPMINLAAAVIRSTARTPAPDPVLIVGGGPGGSSLAYIDAWFASELRAERDIILMDGRGAGYSQPSLNCPEFDAPGLDAVAQCHERLLNAGVNLNAYTTAANAQDTADLTAALGLEQVNLFAVSYGTKVALVMLRDNPAFIRSVILDSVYPPGAPGINEQPASAYRAFEVLFEACAADEPCHAAYPDLRGVFYRTVDALNATPLMLTDAAGFLSGGRLIDDIFYGFYDTGAIPLLPARIYAAGRRDAELYRYLHENEAAVVTLPSTDDDAEGIFFSVECHDAIPLNSQEAAEQNSASIPLPLRVHLMAGVRQQFADCAAWDVLPAAPDEYLPAESSVPVLVLSGVFDPITPPEWGAKAAETLSNSYVYVFPGVGHGVLFNGGSCPMQMALDFLSYPAATPDAGCVEGMQVEFYVAAGF